MKDLYQSAFEIIIKSKNLNNIIEGFYSLIKNPIAIINNDFQLVSYYSPFLFEDETRNESIKVGYLKYETFKKIRETLTPTDSYKIIYNLSSNRRLIINLKKDSKIIGLLIILEIETKLEDISDEFLNLLSQIVVKFLTDQRFASTDNSIDLFFASLLDKVYNDKTIYLEKVKELKIDLSLTYYLLILDFNEQFDERTKNEAETFISKILGTSVIAKTYKNGDYVLLTNSKIKQSEIDAIDDFLFKHRFYMIKSNRIIDLYAIPKIYEELIKLFKILQSNLGDYVLFETSNYLSLQPLVALKREEIVNFIDESIFQIFHYDQANKTNFIDTIYIYLVTNKSLSETSKRLYVHKNTITYRLEKIKELFDVDFDSYSKNFNYIFSITCIYYLQRHINRYLV